MLTFFNGRTITYDEIGNPLSYYNGTTSYSFSWEGRQLTRTARNGVTTYTYNDEGIRTSKTVNGETTTYYLKGSQILAEETSWYLIIYLYDSTNSPIGMMFRHRNFSEGTWEVSWFEKNLQGDIVGVYDVDGNLVVKYEYDAWGNFTETQVSNSHGAFRNPFRYRGYYYDTDLGMYYLQSRYYDPNTCRFINADSALYHSMLGYNTYAYCANNPVDYYDPTGEYYVANVDDRNPLDDWLFEGASGGGIKAGYYGPGTSYYNYQVKMSTAAYDARLGGYHSNGPTSAMYNLSYYCVPGAVSVVDSMAVSSHTKSHPYSHLQDPSDVGAGKDFTAWQKKSNYSTKSH